MHAVHELRSRRKTDCVSIAVTLTPTHPVPRAPKRPQMKPSAILIVGLIACALIIGLGVGIYFAVAPTAETETTSTPERQASNATSSELLDQLSDQVVEASARVQRLRIALRTLDGIFEKAIYSGSKNVIQLSKDTDFDQVITEALQQDEEIDAETPLRNGISLIEDLETNTSIPLTAFISLVDVKRDLQQELQRVKDVREALTDLKAMAGQSEERSEERTLRLAATFYEKFGARINEDTYLTGESLTLRHAISRLQTFVRNQA